MSLLRVVRHSYFEGKGFDLVINPETCFVFGNGPSLSDDLHHCADVKSLRDVWCVNYFADSDLYEVIQPKYYVLADPDFWVEDVSSNLFTYRERLFQSIVSKTTWPLTIYVPFVAKKYVDLMVSNRLNISFSFYNNITVSGYKPLTQVLYNYGLAMPHAQNVLVAALFLSLRRGYKRIIVLGADHSWHETLALDNENRVCLRDQHFYGKASKLTPFYMGGNEQVTFTMPQIFSAFSKMFQGYWEVKAYSESVGAEIYNASSVTYIDAFKRVNAEDVLC
jgi:hypothetical protein